MSGRAVAAILLALLVWLAQVGRGPVALGAESPVPGPVGPGSPNRQLREIAAALRCPVCQNLSVADSPNELAGQMRELIGRKLADGESREQILDYFVARYGEEILLDPPKRGFNLLLWLGPALGLGVGGTILARSLARWRRQGEQVPEGLEAGQC